MPPRRWKLRVRDILDAIENIQQYIEGLDYDAFINDRKTMDAVIRNLITIGEAAAYVPDHVIEAHPEIPWRDMSDMRNIIVHEYFGISDKICETLLFMNILGLVTKSSGKRHKETCHHC